MTLKKLTSLSVALTASALSLVACQTTRSPEHIGWTTVSSLSSSGQVDVYVDLKGVKPSTENETWKTARLLVQDALNDKEQPSQHISSIFDITVDCLEAKLRFDHSKIYSKRNGLGNMLKEQDLEGIFISSEKKDEKALVQMICQ